MTVWTIFKLAFIWTIRVNTTGTPELLFLKQLVWPFHRWSQSKLIHGTRRQSARTGVRRQSWKTAAHACSWLFLARFRSFDRWKFSNLNDVVFAGWRLPILIRWNLRICENNPIQREVPDIPNLFRGNVGCLAILEPANCGKRCSTLKAPLGE